MSDNMEVIKLDNGKELKLCHASFDDALTLKDIIFLEASRNNLDMSYLKNINMEDIKNTEINGGTLELLLKSIMRLEGSRAITDQVFKCLARCTYDKEKITKDTFEDIEARKQFIRIKYEVIKKNMLPFFQNLASPLKKFTEAAKQIMTESLK